MEKKKNIENYILIFPRLDSKSDLLYTSSHYSELHTFAADPELLVKGVGLKCGVTAITHVSALLLQHRHGKAACPLCGCSTCLKKS